MKRLFLIFGVIALSSYLFPKYRTKAVSYITYGFRSLPELPSMPDLKAITSRLKSSSPAGYPGAENFPMTRELRQNSRTWTFTDGSKLDAVLVAADGKNAQLRVPQGVGQVKLELLAAKDRMEIQSWIQSEGTHGVAGLPIALKTHRWPQDWRESPDLSLKQVGDTNRWRSKHFEITNTAGIKREALESITFICESVDGALNSLPLPLPINWGREPGELRKILIKAQAEDGDMVGRPGYWDGRTGIVHIFSDALLEPDLQLVVFEFNKPEKVQKYDIIVHEVTHQSMAALMYLGVPAWVPEGTAEYMSATQLAPAFYQFTNTHVSIRHHFDKRLFGDRIVKDRTIHFTHLKQLMNRDIVEWNRFGDEGDDTGFLQYFESLILIDYFFHRDHADGVNFRRYLETILSGVPEPEARETHLVRGRSYEQIEQEISKLWQPLGFTIKFQSRSSLRPEDITIDWAAEEVKRTIASRRAAEASQRED